MAKESSTQSTNDRMAKKIIHYLLRKHSIGNAKDIQEALKALIGGTLKCDTLHRSNPLLYSR